MESLKIEFSRIADLAEHDTCNTELIKKFIGSLKAINTGSQLDSFLASKQCIKQKGKLIKVQPTARSRRKIQNIKMGGKRILSGRPSKERKHCLSLNIMSNLPNSKIH